VPRNDTLVGAVLTLAVTGGHHCTVALIGGLKHVKEVITALDRIVLETL